MPGLLDDLTICTSVYVMQRRIISADIFWVPAFCFWSLFIELGAVGSGGFTLAESRPSRPCVVTHLYERLLMQHRIISEEVVCVAGVLFLGSFHRSGGCRQWGFYFS